MAILIGSRDVTPFVYETPFDFSTETISRGTDRGGPPERQRAFERALREIVEAGGGGRGGDEDPEEAAVRRLDAFARQGWNPAAEAARGRLVTFVDTEEMVLLDGSVLVKTGAPRTAPEVAEALNAVDDRFELRAQDCEAHPYLRHWWRCRSRAMEGLRTDPAATVEALQERAGAVSDLTLEPFLTRIVSGRTGTPDAMDDDNPVLGFFPLGLAEAWRRGNWRGDEVRVGVVDVGFRDAPLAHARGTVNLASWGRVVASDIGPFRIARGQDGPPADWSPETDHGDICARLLCAAPDPAAVDQERFAFGIAARAPANLVEASDGNRSDWQLSIALCRAALGWRDLDAPPSDIVSCSIGDNTGLGWTPNQVLIDAIGAVTGVSERGGALDPRALLHDHVAPRPGERETRCLFWAVDNKPSRAGDDQVVSHPGVGSVRGARFAGRERLADGSIVPKIEMLPGAGGVGLDMVAPAKGNVLFMEDTLQIAAASNSYATPVAAGVGALVAAHLPGASAAVVLGIVRSTCQGPVEDQFGRRIGIVDALEAVGRAMVT